MSHFFEEEGEKEMNDGDGRGLVLIYPFLKPSLAYISICGPFVQLLFVLFEHKFHFSWLES